jgi:2-C-methyl-D-erythritol 4-phosphate cytidylyltransferase
VIVAAGEGERLGTDLPKAFVPVAGRRMVAWSIDAMRASERVSTIIVVAPRGRVEWAEAALGREASHVEVVEGGATRAVSVARGVAEVPGRTSVVVVHDAARPLLGPALVRRVLDGIGGADGAIAAQRVSDTLKSSSGDERIGRTVSREGLWAAQTPQAFRADPFRDAIARAVADGSIDRMTDCAAIMEAAGRPVNLVASDEPNLKITTRGDLAMVEALLSSAAVVH